MKKIVILCLSVFLVFSIAFSSIHIIKAISDESLNSQKQDATDSSKLNLWSSIYKPTDEQSKEIAVLIKSGADVDILMKICEFWEDTDAPFSIISQIYAKAPDSEALDQISNHTVWIERVYNEITGNDNNLSLEDVKEYLSSGISMDDLYAANRAARKSTISPKDVLDRRALGDSWVEIIAPELEGDFTEEEKRIISGDDLLDSLIIERKTGAEPVKTLKSSIEKNESVMSVYSASVIEGTKITMEENEIEGGVNNEEQ